MDPKSNDIPEKNGGEGNYDASRRYREGVEQTVREGRTEELGEKAKKAVEGQEGDALRRAEEQGKQANIPDKSSRR